MRKLLILICVAAVAGVVAWRVYDKINQKKKRGGEKGKSGFEVAVETAPVTRATVYDVGEFTGSLKPSSEFKVAPKISGRLETLSVDIGDWIENGQRIAVLDSQELKQEINLAKAELSIAQAQKAAVDFLCPKQIEKAKADVMRWEATVALAKKELDRLEKLMAKSITSVSERDRAYEKLMVAEAQLLAMKKDLELAQVTFEVKKKEAMAEVERDKASVRTGEVRLTYTEIHASWDNGGKRWVVGERFVDEGDFLKVGDPIVSILDIDELTAVIHVTEKDYPKLKLGQVVEIETDAYPGRLFKGTVARIAPRVEESSREALVEISVPNKNYELKPGMFIRTRIVFEERKDATVVSSDATVKRRGKWGVFTIDHQAMVARYVPVTVGIQYGELVEIVSPSVNGEVVTLGHHLLSDGTKVIIKNFSRPDSGELVAKDTSPSQGGSAVDNAGAIPASNTTKSPENPLPKESK